MVAIEIDYLYILKLLCHFTVQYQYQLILFFNQKIVKIAQ